MSLDVYNECVINGCKLNIDIGILVKTSIFNVKFSGSTVMSFACIFEMPSRTL